MRRKIFDRQTTEALVEKAQAGCLDSLSELLENNMGYIFNSAERFITAIPRLEEDILNEARIGFCLGVLKYKKGKGTSLCSYAKYWAIQRIQSFINEMITTIRVPVPERNKVINDDCPTQAAVNANSGYLPLDFVQDGFDCPLHDTIPAPEPDNEFADDEKEIALSILNNGVLTCREKEVIKRRFGFYGKIETSWLIGNSLGISHQAVCQIQVRALHKIKRAFRKYTDEQTAKTQ